jgi:2-polyprenyl-3-methyl-5-hydroxy-6-metoxy-1,4-benzoquinol methylase
MRDPGTSNHEKYTQGAQNPLVRALMRGLFRKMDGLLQGAPAESLLDAGCGEGHALNWLSARLPERVVGFDLNPAAVELCQAQFPEGEFSVQNIYDLPYDDDSFDLVMSMEVLEHLERPADALAELARVCRGQLLLSVPFEPWFQVGNLARGKYKRRLGNHPEHIQHWGLRSFERFLQAEAQLSDVRVQQAWPWLVARASLRDR